MATYYVDLASGTMPLNDGLTETGFFGWAEFYNHVFNGVGHENDTYKLRNTRYDSSATVYLERFHALVQWNIGTPWRIINLVGSITASNLYGSTIAEISGGILGASGWVSIEGTKVTNCFIQAEVLEIPRSTITTNSGIYDGCTIDVSGLYLPSNNNLFYMHNTIINAESFTQEATAYGNSGYFENIVTNMSESDFTSNVSVSTINCEFDYDLPDYADASGITESGLATTVVKKYGLYTNPSGDMFNNQRYAVGAVTPSSIVFFTADPPSGAEPLTVFFTGYTNATMVSPTWTWDFDDSSPNETGQSLYHTYSSSGIYTPVLTVISSEIESEYNTFIFDNFSGGVFDSFWNPDATGMYTIVSTPSGNAASWMGGSVLENMRMLSPWGVHISGDFDFNAEFIISGTLTSTWPSIGILSASGDTGLEGEHWASQGYDALYEVAEIHLAGSGHASGYALVDLESYQSNISFSPSLNYSGVNNTVSIRLIRENGIISGYYRQGKDSWSSLSGQIVYSGEAVLELNGAPWAKVLSINCQADDGLPYYLSSNSIYKKTCAPNWVYLSGYIYDSFASSGLVSGWASDAYDLEIMDVSGYYAYANGNLNDRLIPSGDTISGNFDFQFDFVINSGTQTNESEHFQFMTPGGSAFAEFYWAYDKLYGYSQLISAPEVHGRRYTCRATRGYYLEADGTPIKETSLSGIHFYYYDNWSGGATYTWKEFDGSPNTTSDAYGNFYIQNNGANLNGIDNLKLQADFGLPYDTTVEPTYIGETSSYNLSSSGQIVVVYLPSTVVTGAVEGAGYISSFPNFENYTSGNLYGVGCIGGVMSFYFPPSPEPPTSSGSLKKGIKPLLTNKSRYPYKTPSDVIVSKIDFLQNGRLSYISGLPVELWMNYSGDWTMVEEGVTDRYGSCYIAHPTSGIPNITNCLGVVKVTYNGADYVSNVMRYNFYSGIAYPEDLVYIIDAAATGSVPDRLAHDIFDSSGRLNFFDRIYV